MNNLKRWFKKSCSAGLLSLLLLTQFIGVAHAVTTTNDFACATTDTCYYDPGASSSCSGSTSPTVLVGSDNAQKTFNYFKSKGLDDLHVAAIMGNLQQESSFNPTAMQDGGNSQNPADAGSKGWGIAQWTPGSNIIDIAKGLNITGPIYDLSTQLDIVWGEMQGTSPPGVKDVLSGLKQQTTLPDAVNYFMVNFEAAGIPGPRLAYAEGALRLYGGSPTGTITIGSASCGSSASLSPDCQAAIGVARILCAAKQYDPVSYSESLAGGHQGGAAWHQSCPIIGPSCVLDCSGLVNIAVYDVYHVDLRENTYSEASDSQYWQHIQLSQAQPGDLIQPNPGHVEVIDHVTGSTIYTFGSHSSDRAQPDQVSPSAYPIDPSYVYLHYVGPGA